MKKRHHSESLFSVACRLASGALIVLLLLTACEKQAAVTADCDIDTGPCVRMAGDMAVTLDITPKPVRAMRELAFVVTLQRSGVLVKRAQASLDLSMPGMEMGKNIVPLVPAAEGRYAGKGVIVRCASGRTDWKATVMVIEGERSSRAEFLLTVP
jgi:hypothetical protein